MDSLDTRYASVGFFKEVVKHFFVSYEAGDGNLPTLLPDWDSVEPKVYSASIQSHPESSAGVSPRTAVMIHAYHEEGVGALLGRMRNTVWPASFFFTADTPEKACRIREVAINVLGSGASFEVRLVPNRGRDVLPFWISLKEDAADYDIFFKLHLKRSTHIDSRAALSKGAITGKEWAEDIQSCLIPSSPASFRAMQSLLDPGRLGALYPKPWGPLAMYGWGVPANLHWVADILKAHAMDNMKILLPLIYPVGNMFIGSVSSFLPFSDFFVKLIGTPREPLPIDGTVLHGIERCYSYLLAAKGENVGVLFPPRPEDLSGELRYWSFPMTEFYQCSHSPADVLFDRAILSTATRLGLVEMERHCKQLREIAKLERQNSALVEQIKLMSRSPLRRLMSRLVRD